MEGTAVQTDTGGRATNSVQIIGMLYEGAINFIGKAKEKMEAGDHVGRNHFIKKTSAIVKELSNSINMEGGEIAANLRNLYDFVLESLVKAEVNHDINALSDAEKVVEILRDAWSDMQNTRQL